MDLDLKRIKFIADFTLISDILTTFSEKSIGSTTHDKINALIDFICDSAILVNQMDLERKASEKSLLKEKELNLKLQMDMNRLKLEHESELISIKFENENRVNQLEEQLRKLI